jgi:hypothetical protein
MATLAGQRAQFTWSLNQYNLSEDPETRIKFAKRMAKYIAAAPSNGFTANQITQDKNFLPKSTNMSVTRASPLSLTFRKSKRFAR